MIRLFHHTLKSSHWPYSKFILSNEAKLGNGFHSWVFVVQIVVKEVWSKKGQCDVHFVRLEFVVGCLSKVSKPTTNTIERKIYHFTFYVDGTKKKLEFYDSIW
jgi:hypothetical protein